VTEELISLCVSSRSLARNSYQEQECKITPIRNTSVMAGFCNVGLIRVWELNTLMNLLFAKTHEPTFWENCVSAAMAFTRGNCIVSHANHIGPSLCCVWATLCFVCLWAKQRESWTYVILLLNELCWLNHKKTIETYSDLNGSPHESQRRSLTPSKWSLWRWTSDGVGEECSIHGR
jgi:hypothetical protein